MPAITANSNAKQTQPKPQPQGFKQKNDNKFEAIPEGVYDAEIARIEYRDRASYAAEGRTWPSWKKHDAEISIGFRLTETPTNGKYKNRWFFGEAPFDLSEGARLRIWLQEIVGLNPLPDDFVFDTDELSFYEGLDCRVRLNTFWSKKEEVNKNGVAEVLRAAQGSYNDTEEPF